MKSVLSLLIVVALAGSLSAQSRYPAPQDMQTVHIALLLSGPNTAAMPVADEEKIQAAHIGHLGKLGAEGHAYIAGPIDKGGDLRGIILLKAPTADAARAFEAEDPAVKAGRLRIEIVSYTAPASWFSFAPIPSDISMRMYVFGYLMQGPNRGGTAEENAKILDDHLANLWKLRESGALVSAGPIANGGDRAGVVIFAVDSVERANALLAMDPAVQAGVFTPKLYAWFAADRILKGK